MEKSLHEAVITGNTSQLLALLQVHPDLLVRALHDCKGKNNPVHVGTSLGHANLVREVLNRKPEFASELNSQGQYPLHLASAKGHVEIVKELLKVNSHVCFLNDRDGKTPFHEAAMKGRVEVLKELYGVEPKAVWVLTDQGEPILHVCVNYNQFEAMNVLLELIKDEEFVNMKDQDDNTILHILVAKDNYKVIKYLIHNKIGVHVNSINVNKWTALDIARNTSSGSNCWKIKGILKSVGAKTATKLLSLTQPRMKKGKEVDQTWLSEMKESLMVVAALMATITYQAGLNPSGGVFQDTGNHTLTQSNGTETETIPHVIGTAVMSSMNAYKYFTLFNTTGLLASLSLILLLVGGLSFQRKISIWALVIITWISIASILGSYLCSFAILTPPEIINEMTFWVVVPLTILILLLLMLILLGANIFSWLRRRFYMVGFPHSFQIAMKSLFSKAHKQLTRSKGSDDTTVEPRADHDP